MVEVSTYIFPSLGEGGRRGAGRGGKGWGGGLGEVGGSRGALRSDFVMRKHVFR